MVDSVIQILSRDESLLERYDSDIAGFKQSREKWGSDKIRVGVIGVTSSGKSTMINSILGDKLLSMAVRPSSSQLVTCLRSDEKKATVFFKGKEKKKIVLSNQLLTPENIKRYSDENYNSENKEQVEQLELSTPTFDLGSDVLLVDSPGLDAYGLQNHEQLTLEVLLPNIDVCIFVTTLKTNSDEKMKSVLDVIAKYKCPLIIVQNMLDSLKPSIDGTKNVQQVATEHKKRVQRIVNNSKIENKGSVRIVQISAAQALRARCEEAKGKEEQEKLLQSSNYNIFIQEVLDTIQIERPNIEYARINSIVERTKKLISDAEEDLSGEISLVDTKFEYEGLDDEVIRKANETESRLSGLLNLLDSKPNKLALIKNDFMNMVQFSQKEQFSESDITKIKELVKNCEKQMLNEISKFNFYLKEISEKLNIPSRDIISLNGLPSMPQLDLKKRTDVTYRKVPKSSFGSGVKRLFGKLFDKDWGYEYIPDTVTVIDHAGTKKEIEAYILRAKKSYIKEISSWTKKTKVPIDNILEIIENRRRAFEQRKHTAIKEEKLREATFSLGKLLDLIRDNNKGSDKKKMKVSDAEISISLEKAAFNKSAYNIAKLAEKVSNSIFISTTSLLLDKHNALDRDSYIFGWDLSCMTAFAKRFLGISITQRQITMIANRRFIKVDRYNFYFNPSEDDVENVMKEEQEKNVYILTNTTQYGSAQTQIHRSGICNSLSNKDFLVFVIQDFTEIINGGGIPEAIGNMMLLTKNLNIQHPSMIFINHENPIYNLAIIEAQSGQNNIMIEETEILKKIQGNFSYLRDEVIDKQIANIIRAAN
ncbi:hypothetical protein CFB3_34050 [Clostridium folliculivorans]|nr:hypothetical protein CFB3_34050 [Clostridium folliculivorans]